MVVTHTYRIYIYMNVMYLFFISLPNWKKKLVRFNIYVLWFTSFIPKLKQRKRSNVDQNLTRTPRRVEYITWLAFIYVVKYCSGLPILLCDYYYGGCSREKSHKTKMVEMWKLGFYEHTTSLLFFICPSVFFFLHFCKQQ